jgi:hypothetical protein
VIADCNKALANVAALGALPPGALPYFAVSHLFLDTMGGLEGRRGCNGSGIADERKYADVPSVAPISEVVV